MKVLTKGKKERSSWSLFIIVSIKKHVRARWVMRVCGFLVIAQLQQQVDRASSDSGRSYQG